MVHVFIIPQIDVDVADRLSLSGSKHVVTAGALVEADDGTLAPRCLVLLASTGLGSTGAAPEGGTCEL